MCICIYIQYKSQTFNSVGCKCIYLLVALAIYAVIWFLKKNVYSPLHVVYSVIQMGYPLKTLCTSFGGEGMATIYTSARLRRFSSDPDTWVAISELIVNRVSCFFLLGFVFSWPETGSVFIFIVLTRCNNCE